MKIDEQLNSIVAAIVSEIKTKVDAEIASTISASIQSTVANYDFDQTLSDLAEPKITEKIKNYPVDVAAISSQIGQAGETILANLKDTVTQQVADVAKEYIANYEILPVIEQEVAKYLTQAKFPNASISHSAINFNGAALSGDYVTGGIIKDFSSTGIDDKATQCQLVVRDDALVVEPPILTSGIQVKGSVKVEKTLIAQKLYASEISEDSPGFNQVVAAANDSVKQTLAAEGVVAPKLEWDGKTLIDRDNLAPSIVTSNLRRVGTLEELQTRGETLLDQTLYVNKGRVGINTLEATYALSVWDEEVEVAINKQAQNRAFIGTHRPFNVTLGAAGKENISLEVDGSVTINDLRLGALPISTASTEPNWSGRAGEIVFNDSPQIGKPIGWVCLQGTRWAKFGLIQE